MVRMDPPSDRSDRSDPARPSAADVDPRHWREERGRLVATFATGDFVRGAELVARVVPLAEEQGHHPDVLLTYPTVRVELVSHDVGRLTDRDVRLARALTALVDELGVPAAPD
jgi:4a-hydroxytetrahydrobiopterin dehydratase